MIKNILAGISGLIGIIGGLYVGLYLMFFRGIIQIVTNATPEVIAGGLTIGIIKVVFASVVGYIIMAIGIGIGRLIIWS